MSSFGGVPCTGCVLLVDDDADIRDALTACFQQLGCSVVAAADGRDALEALKHCRQPCFILLDMNMPRLDGDGLTSIVRASDCHHCVPIVTMSASQARPSWPSMVHSHLEKPFHFDALAPTIEQLCQDPDWLHGHR